MLSAVNKYISRLLAVLLAAAICFGFAPVAFAMEGEGETPEIQEENVETQEENKPEVPKVTSGNCGAGLSWNFSGGTLSISGSGEMDNYSESRFAPWYDLREEIVRVSLPNGLTSVGSLAFYRCKNITAVTIPGSVEKIGQYAFADCRGLQILNLGGGVRSIGEGAFSDCLSIVSLNLPGSLNSIGMKAFYRCETITTVTVPASVTNIGLSAFGYCKNLVSATINAQISVLPEFMFYGCEKLSSVTLPETLREVGEYCFEECDNLTNVYYNGESIPSEDLEKEIGGTVSKGEAPGESSGGILKENEDGTVISENTSVSEGEDSTVTTTTETVIDPEEGTVESSKSDIIVSIEGDKGWEEVTEKIENILDEIEADESNSEKHTDIYLFITMTENISKEFIESIAGKDVTVTITTENGSVWIINGKDIDIAQLSGNYNLAYVLEAGSPELCEKLRTGTSFVLKFLSPAEINAEVLIRIGGNYARQNASLFQDGKELTKVQSVVVDNEGYAHFYLGSVTEKTEYYIGMNVPGASEEAIVPQNMLAEYGNAEFTEPIKYEITGRTSSWGMGLGQVMSILAAVMVTVIIIVGAVMFFWNRQRLKNGYVPDLDEEET